MNSFRLYLLFFLNILMSGSLQAQQPPRPKMVVGIVVDQMRWDYLYRYLDRYGEGGFKRLMREGYNFQQAYIDYIPTFTAPGHASIYTGSVPALHGIVANDWVDIRSGRSWYCVEDTTVRSLGGGKEGLMSPRNLLASTIADELKLATNFRSKTFGISIKDRGAILPAGHTADAAYWYDGQSGHFISSSFYRDELPAWVKEFNGRGLADSLLKLNWQTLYPLESYTQSTPDDSPYEGLFGWEEKPVFPHLTGRAAFKDRSVLRGTPHGNTLVRLMAEACIRHEALGQDAVTDFLALSFSSPDYIGHQFGPNAVEVEDQYLRLDLELAGLLQFLDQEIGKGEYLLFLSADHGAAHNALFMQDHRLPARSVSVKGVLTALNDTLKSAFKVPELVLSLMNYQVYLNESVIRQAGLDRETVKIFTAAWLRKQEGVSLVVDMESAGSQNVPAVLSASITNGYYHNRCGSLQIILNPGWYSGYGPTGTTHGSWNPYDAHIPLLFFGWGVSPGESYRRVNMTDIAPTLSALLHIQVPNAAFGKVILPISGIVR